MVQAINVFDIKIVQDKSKTIVVPGIDLLPELCTERPSVLLLPASQEWDLGEILADRIQDRCGIPEIGQEVIVYHAYGSAGGSQRPEMIGIGDLNSFHPPEHTDGRIPTDNNVISWLWFLNIYIKSMTGSGLMEKIRDQHKRNPTSPLLFWPAPEATIEELVSYNGEKVEG